MKILAIETSCDETAAAVIEKNDNKIAILSNVIASQIDIHKKYGGVFPEIASRAHTEQIIPVIEKALSEAGLFPNEAPVSRTKSETRLARAAENEGISRESLKNIDLIAVTAGPGLIGSLLIGVNTAKALAFSNPPADGKPIIGINHWLGHIYSCFSQEKQPEFPLLALIVSGGHTGLVLMKSPTEIVSLGETLDDAAGEAFDKVAKLLELGYPGGPAISIAAESIKNQESGIKGLNIEFPRAMMNSGDYNFSFSGLKTAVLNKVRELTKTHKLEDIQAQVAFEFQQAVIDVLIHKTLKATEEFQPKSVCLCGGVSANKKLREQLKNAVELYNESRIMNNEKSHDSNFKIHNTISFFVPPMALTGDNAAMIGIAAAYQPEDKWTTFDQIDADSNLKLS